MTRIVPITNLVDSHQFPALLVDEREGHLDHAMVIGIQGLRRCVWLVEAVSKSKQEYNNVHSNNEMPNGTNLTVLVATFCSFSMIYSLASFTSTEYLTVTENWTEKMRETQYLRIT